MNRFVDLLFQWYAIVGFQVGPDPTRAGIPCTKWPCPFLPWSYTIQMLSRGHHYHHCFRNRPFAGHAQFLSIVDGGHAADQQHQVAASFVYPGSFQRSKPVHIHGSLWRWPVLFPVGHCASSLSACSLNSCLLKDRIAAAGQSQRPCLLLPGWDSPIHPPSNLPARPHCWVGIDLFRSFSRTDQKSRTNGSVPVCRRGCPCNDPGGNHPRHHPIFHPGWDQQNRQIASCYNQAPACFAVNGGDLDAWTIIAVQFWDLPVSLRGSYVPNLQRDILTIPDDCPRLLSTTCLSVTYCVSISR